MSTSRPVAGDALVMVVSDRRFLGRPLDEWAGEVARAGADWLLVREKDLGDAALLRLTWTVVAAVLSVPGTRTRVLLSGRPDLALLAGADGVVVSEAGLPVVRVRETFPTLVVGVTAHSAATAAQAARDGAHLVVLGPLLRTPGREERVLGLDALVDAAASCPVPLYASGGVDPTSASRLRAAGAAGLAASRCFADRPVARTIAAMRAS